MARPFDAALKELIGAYPRDWVEQLGFRPAGEVRVVEAELSTVSAEADKLLLVEEPTPWLLHLELQSGADGSLDERMLRYNVLIRERHRLPVHSAVFLLRPQADAASNTGSVRYQTLEGLGRLDFRYQRIRVWQTPVEQVLQGGVGTLPLAPLCETGSLEVSEVIRRMDERLDRETQPAQAARLWTSAYILMGLRFQPDVSAALLQGVVRMKESSTYQVILQEGRREGEQVGSVAEARRILLMLGEERLGPAPAEVRQLVERESGVERLEELVRRIVSVSSWDQLFA